MESKFIITLEDIQLTTIAILFKRLRFVVCRRCILKILTKSCFILIFYDYILHRLCYSYDIPKKQKRKGLTKGDTIVRFFFMNLARFMNNKNCCQ